MTFFSITCHPILFFNSPQTFPFRIIEQMTIFKCVACICLNNTLIWYCLYLNDSFTLECDFSIHNTNFIFRYLHSVCYKFTINFIFVLILMRWYIVHVFLFLNIQSSINNAFHKLNDFKCRCVHSMGHPFSIILIMC